MSLESGDMAYLLMLNEYIDVEEFISEVDMKENERKAKTNSKRK